MEAGSEKISIGTKLGYGAAAIGDAASYGFIGTFLLFFLTSIAGINPVIAGTIAAVGSIVDSLCSPVFGYVSDRSQFKSGRRRPFLMVAAVPLGLATALLFSPVGFGGAAKVLYNGGQTVAFWLFFSLFFVPYLALGAEITCDYRERTVLRAYAYFFNFFGMLIGNALPTFVVDHRCSAGATEAQGWQSAGFIVAAVTTISILVTWRCTKGKERFGGNIPTEEAQKKSGFALGFIGAMFKEYGQMLRLKSLRYLIGGSIFFLIANTMVGSDRMYFLQFNLAMAPDVISQVYFISTAVGVVFVPLIIASSKRIDKRTTFMVCILTSAIGMVLMTVLGINSFWSVVAISFIFALGSSCYWQLLPAMIYDVCEAGELITGQRREGTIMSLQSLSEALSTAVSVQILGIILGLSGFQGEAAVQTQLTMDWIGYCFTIIPALAMIASVVMIAKYPITSRRYNMILEALEKRSKGEECEIEELEKLL